MANYPQPGIQEDVEQGPSKGPDNLKIPFMMKNFIRMMVLLVAGTTVYNHCQGPKPLVKSVVQLADSEMNEELACLLDRYNRILARSMKSSAFGEECFKEFPYLREVGDKAEISRAVNSRVLGPLGLVAPDGEPIVEWEARPEGHPRIAQKVSREALLAVDQTALAEGVDNVDHLLEVAK